jgi:Protein of unknown function with HXXEE motif
MERERANVRLLVRYALEVLTVYAIAMLGVLVVFSSSLLLVQQLTIGFLVLITLHEWEENRYPGGFLEVMGGMMHVDFSKVPAERIHLRPIVYIVVLTALPLIFPGAGFLFLAVMNVGLFEGTIHVVGIKLTHQTRPYTPGMVTAIVMFIYAIFGIYRAASAGLIAPLDWLLGLVLFVVSFGLMEVSLLGVLGLSVQDVAKNVRANRKRSA